MTFDEHFFQDQYAFLTKDEYKAFCHKYRLNTPARRVETIALLRKYGGRDGRVIWGNGVEEECMIHVGLRDQSLCSTRNVGRGAILVEDTKK